MISVLYDDYSNLNKLFDENYKYNKSKNMYIKNTNKDMHELIQNTIKIIDQHYFDINPLRYYIEFHKYIVDGKIKPFFDFHQDDHGAVNYKTITCIYYLQKDITINGGDLEFKKHGIINIKSNMLVIFSGHLTHRPTIMNGNGIRKSIVIQFQRL